MAYYESSKIVVFPSSSATDSGKRLTEENVKDIVTRITNRNYKLDADSFEITDLSNSIRISSGSANIQGYKIVTTANITIPYPEDDGEYIIGLKLRFDAGTGNILGDVNGSNVGVDAGFFSTEEYGDDVNIIHLAIGTLESGELTIVEDEEILYRIDNALYAKNAGAVLFDGVSYVIDQNLRTTDDVFFKSVTTDNLLFKEGESEGISQYSDLKEVVDAIRDSIKGIKGTNNWNDEADSDINKLQDEKLDKDEVVEIAEANKVLRLNAAGVLPASITGDAKHATTAGSSTYAQYIGSEQSHFTINQNLRKTDSPVFNSLYLGNQEELKNFIYENGVLAGSASTSFELLIGGTKKLNLNSNGNVEITGTLRASKVYNATFNDYAEWYEKDDPNEEINPGDIVEINPDTGKYRLCTAIASNLVIGVCSNSYGHILGGEELENMEDNKKKYVPVGLSGRVYVNVEDGVNIMPGQLIVSSYNGKAMTKVKAQEGTVVGKALGYVQKIDDVRKVLMQIMLR